MLCFESCTFPYSFNIVCHVDPLLRNGKPECAMLGAPKTEVHKGEKAVDAKTIEQVATAQAKLAVPYWTWGVSEHRGP